MSDKHYALFAGSTYYPIGGFSDFKGLHSELESATSEGKRMADDECGWFHVVDLRTLEIVAKGSVGWC